jgi:hypothetical protein
MAKAQQSMQKSVFNGGNGDSLAAMRGTHFKMKKPSLQNEG